MFTTSKLCVLIISLAGSSLLIPCYGDTETSVGNGSYTEGMRRLDAGDFKAAESLFRQTIGDADEVLRGKSLDALARSLNAQGKPADALPYARQALVLREESRTQDPQEIASALLALGCTQFSLRDYVDAERLAKRALTILEKHPEENVDALVGTYNLLASVYLALGNVPTLSEIFAKQAIEILEAQPNNGGKKLAESLEILVFSYLVQNKASQAEPLEKRALQIREETLGRDHPLVALSLMNLAAVKMVAKDYEGAEPLLKRAVKIYGKLRDYKNADMIISKLADINQSMGRYDQSERYYRHLLNLREVVDGKSSPRLVEPLKQLSELLRRSGRTTEADEMAARASELSSR